MYPCFVAVQNDRSTPLHLACTQGATEVVKLMLSSFHQVEDIINLTDGANQTPLHRWAYSIPPPWTELFWFKTNNLIWKYWLYHFHNYVLVMPMHVAVKVDNFPP